VTAASRSSAPIFVTGTCMPSGRGCTSPLYQWHLLTPELADLLAEYPPWETEITFMGHSRDVRADHGVPDSYARCRRGIDLLLERGLA